MARPRKKEDELHSIQLKLWLTDDQEQLLLDIAGLRDCPKGIVAREALLVGLAKYRASIQKQQAA